MDRNCHYAQWPKDSENQHMWSVMNLIISVDYGRNSFAVIKNRWGPEIKSLPLEVLATFLFNPDIADARDLNMLRLVHSNLFACGEPEQ